MPTSKKLMIEKPAAMVLSPEQIETLRTALSDGGIIHALGIAGLSSLTFDDIANEVTLVFADGTGAAPQDAEHQGSLRLTDQLTGEIVLELRNDSPDCQAIRAELRRARAAGTQPDLSPWKHLFAA